AQAFANHAKLRRSAALRARSRQAQCQTRAGAGNHRRRDAASGRREAGNEETENPDHEPESNPPGTPTTTTTRHDALRAATVLRRLLADVLRIAVCSRLARAASLWYRHEADGSCQSR